MSDSVLQKIFQGCTKLASLDISFCSNVFQSDKTLKYLGTTPLHSCYLDEGEGEMIRWEEDEETVKEMERQREGWRVGEGKWCATYLSEY